MPLPTPFTDDYTDDFGPDQPDSRAYRLLADHIRDADLGQLGSFLESAEQALAPQKAFLDAADPDTGVGGISQPVDPAYAPSGWLPMLAWMLGGDIRGLTDEQARWYLSRIGDAPPGSRQGVAVAVAATLTGARYVAVDCPSMWTMTVSISVDEAPDIGLTTLVAQRTKPAGVNLTVTPSDPVTLADLAVSYASLAAITATGKTLDQLRFG